MAILAVAYITDMRSIGTGFQCEVVAAAVGGPTASGRAWSDELSATALVTTINAECANTAQSYLETEHGIEFGPFDTVRLLNGLV